MPYQVSMMGWVGSGEDFCGLGWVGLGPEIFGWVGFLKSDPWPTLPPHINNEEVRRRTGQPPVTSVIAKRRLRLFGSCGLRGCKNRPAPFPGPCRTRRLNQALSVLSLSLGFLWLRVVLLTRDSFCVVLFFMLFTCSVAWLFLLGCQYQYKWLTGKTRLRNDQMCWWGR